MGLLKRRMSLGLQWPDPKLQADEQVEHQVRANWSRRGVARGGTLVLTDSRVIFQPNSMEASFGLRPATWARPDVRGVDVAPRGWHPLAGALRRRLRISFIDGTSELFVVGNPDHEARMFGSGA